MKTESEYIGIANYCEIRYEYEPGDFIYAAHSFNPRTLLNQGKQDALWLTEPQSKDFDYLCGWHSQQVENLKAEEEFRRTGFIEF